MAKDDGSGDEAQPTSSTYCGVEGEYTAYVLIKVRGYGDPKVNQEATLAALRREVGLNYGERAEIMFIEEADAIQLLQYQMELPQVPEVDPFPGVPGVSLTPFAAG